MPRQAGFGVIRAVYAEFELSGLLLMLDYNECRSTLCTLLRLLVTHNPSPN